MRLDQLVAEPLQDRSDLRALLLTASTAELARLTEMLGAQGRARDLERLARRIDSLAGKVLSDAPGKDRFPAMLAWAAERAGVESHAGQDETERALAALSDGDASAHAANQDEAALLRIAVFLARLRVKKTRRLGKWGPVLDWFTGPGQPPSKADKRTMRRATARADDPGEALDSEAIWKALKGTSTRLPLSVWEERLTEARKALGRFNIIVAGRTGVGKTTLIGAIFGEDVGNTLMGRPRTRGRLWYPVDPTDADILRLCDTEGLEMARYQETLDGLKREISGRNSSSDPFDHIHVAWLCIDETSLTVQPGEEALVKMLAHEGVPVIVVLTKAGMAPSFEETVRQLIPRAAAVVRVRAAPISIEDQTFPQMGLDRLMEATEGVIPDAVHSAWHVASRNLEANLRRSESIVRRAAATAGAAGAAPIPLADAAGVFGVQVGMIVAVSLNMGVKLKRSDLQAMGVTLLGALGLTAGGRFVAGQVFKLIPGLGTIAGSAITGSTAAALTYGLGRAYLQYLRSFFGRNQRMPEPDELVSGFQRYWREWKNKYEPPPIDSNS